jgi:hypothetical protein
MYLDLLCEILLAAACGWATWCSWRNRSSLSGTGFLIFGLAALAGALQYSGVRQATEAHQYLTLWGSRMGLALIAIGTVIGNAVLLVAVGLCVALLFVPAPVVLVANFLALIAIAYEGWSRRSWSLIVGAILFFLAAVVVGAQSRWFDLPRVDILHVGLAVAVLMSVPREAAADSRVTTGGQAGT